MFIVPLANVYIGRAAAIDLCYEIHGSADTYYNFISDRYYSVNARYAVHATMGEELTVVDQITIHAARTNGHCVDIVIELDGPTCVATVNGAVLQGDNGEYFDNGGVEVRSFQDNNVLVIVPSGVKEGGGVPVELTVKCREWKNTNIIEFQVQNGKGISPDAHGLIG